MPSSVRPMRCEERGVDRFECPSVSVLYHYPSLKIDRSYLKKDIRCHASAVCAAALRAPEDSSSGTAGCAFGAHVFEDSPTLVELAE